MSSEPTAVAAAEPNALAELPDARLRPSSVWVDVGTNVGVYFALLIPAVALGPVMQLSLVVAALGFAVYRRRAALRAAATRRELYLALAKDDVDGAATLGRRLVLDAPRRSLSHALAVGCWGEVQLRRGRPEAAVDYLARALDTGRLRGETWALEAKLALAHAVVGDLEAATARLQTAEAGLSERGRGALFVVHVLVLARAGKLDAVFDHFDTRWREAEPLLSIAGARKARMLEAFALERTQSSQYREAGQARLGKALDEAREARPGAYGYLAVLWPELREFLDRHGLS